MNKLRQILEFIMSLLGFLLNLKKKEPDGKNEEPVVVLPGELPGEVEEGGSPEGIGIVSGRPRDSGLVGGPFGGGPGMCRGPLDTLGVRAACTRQFSSFVGWTMLAYAVGMSLWGG
ncbi:hypothetical protein [uncultured Parabacteroides sp.]|uniref:hypothetical protein n=1 Tax=uncultured Parabacteroides sp. TaxID=512312 RepID=UPI0025E77A60|nr:hypothetical protein [uncultured Parabacteroides sp.]